MTALRKIMEIWKKEALKRFDRYGRIHDCLIINGEPATIGSTPTKCVRGKVDHNLLCYVDKTYSDILCEILKDLVSLTDEHGTITVVNNFGKIRIEI